MSDVALLHGDCLEVMRTFGDATVDAVVCDPPYHLTSIVERFGKENSAPAKSDGATGVYARASKGFMGQTWDGGDIAFRVETWREVLRVLKPGGYLLAFSGTRTYHRMAVAIEDAGFEIRDCIGWHYGSGFPKSHAVDAAIDKMDRAEFVEARARAFTAWMRSTGITARQIDDATGTCMGNHYTTHPTQPAVATADLFDLLRPLLPPVPAEIEELVRSRTVESENMKRRPVVGRSENGIAGGTGKHAGTPDAYGFAATFDVTEPYTDAAKTWKGWGTALKPAWEPIVVARKPLEGTVAANVLKHGTGALNIDGCRVALAEGEVVKAGLSDPANRAGVVGRDLGFTGNDAEAFQQAQRESVERTNTLGRWPANIILSHAPDCGEEGCVPGCPCAAMDAQSGGEAGASRYFNNLPIEDEDLVPFVYSSKASKRERNEGLPEGVTCTHPTVKPVSVMRHLVRLCCRKGGIVLDPFMGSGTTGVAAVREGVDFVGIEMSEEYLRIAEARVESARKQREG